MLQVPPPPPALVQPAPDREITFSGFNGLPLKASVRRAAPATSHPYYAVLVAGTGPMDREWSSPLLPKGRTGRDLAAWLQDQGLGSLRYDKRYIGSRDPGLDISLEAQAGDLKAALQTARSLPEAKGKKLLLVAHSEGTLVSLVAASGADAALLFAMPVRSMADMLRDQVRSQLQGDSAKDNLAYLDTVLDAIRQGNPTPDPTTTVLPGLYRMAKSLMAKETLTFVKGTLDLDPWTLVNRLPIPVACAWGDRDLLAPKPAAPPQGFRGTVLDLTETNHLLRKEVRERQVLDPVKARSAYGEDTPLADLGPVATWLKGLK